jgi:NADH-quinone oxidoreductase subunit E/NADP-reducing hydrogenase subunit HndA
METDQTTACTTAPAPQEKKLDPQKALDILNQYPPSRRYLIPILQKIQDAYRFLPPDIIKLVIKRLGATKAQVYGVITFYPQFRVEEPGRFIVKLCFGTACFVKGAPIIAQKIKDKYHIGPGQTDAKKVFTLQTASCLGNCGAAPMAIIGKNTHGTIDPEQTYTMLDSYENQPAEEAPQETSVA